jgi:hypothetical protein
MKIVVTENIDPIARPDSPICRIMTLKKGGIVPVPNTTKKTHFFLAFL